jgi:hypothetical protein
MRLGTKFHNPTRTSLGNRLPGGRGSVGFVKLRGGIAFRNGSNLRGSFLVEQDGRLWAGCVNVPGGVVEKRAQLLNGKSEVF